MKKNMQNNDQQRSAQATYSEVIKKKVNDYLQQKVGGKFIPVSYPAGFNYIIENGSVAGKTRYNNLTLKTLDRLFCVDPETGMGKLKSQTFSQLYSQVIADAEYTLSKKDQKKLNDNVLELQAQSQAVVNAYNKCGLPVLEAVELPAQMVEVITNLSAKFGEIDMDCSNIPSSCQILKIALQEYLNLTSVSDIIFVQTKALARKGSIQGAKKPSAYWNTIEPSANNGGQPTDEQSGAYYVSYENLPDNNQLMGALRTTDNAITVSLYSDNFSSSETKMHIENEYSFKIPILNIFDIKIDNENTYDINKLKTSQTTCNIEINYPGITVVPGETKMLSNDNKLGWYDEQILHEICIGTNDTSRTGFKLGSDRFKVEQLFGKDGELTRLGSFVLSQEPTVTITFSNVNLDYAKSVFHSSSSVETTLFGFIPLGKTTHDYTCTDVSFDESALSFTITLGPPEISGTIDPTKAVAFVMGGVPYCPSSNED